MVSALRSDDTSFRGHGRLCLFLDCRSGPERSLVVACIEASYYGSVEAHADFGHSPGRPRLVQVVGAVEAYFRVP